MKNVDVKMDSKIKMMTHYFPVKILTNVLLLIVATEFVEIRSEVSAVIVIKDSITSCTTQVTSVV